MADLQHDVERGRRKRCDVVCEAGLAERQPRRAGREVFAQHGGPAGQDGGDRKSTVADDLQRHALTDLGFRARIERQREVGVRVNVDESRRHDLAARVDDAAGRAGRARLDGDDAAGAHAHVGLTRLSAGAVDQLPAPDQQIIHAVLR